MGNSQPQLRPPETSAMPLILLLITELGSGGAEQIVFALATRRPAENNSFSFAIAALDGRGLYAEKLRENGIAVYDLGARSIFNFKALLRLRRLLQTLRPALLHTHLVHANIAGRLAAAGLRIPVLSTCHIMEARNRPWHFWLDRLTAPLAQCEVCVSAAAAEFQAAKTGLPEAFFPIIANGIDLQVFYPPIAAERAVLQERLLGGSSPQEPLPRLCGFLGRLDRQKGVDILLAAWRLLPTAIRKNWRLLIGGDGPEKTNLQMAAADLPEIIFCGYQTAPRDFLAALDVAVMPSRYEGYGLAAAEAMACGAALTASSLPALRETIGGGGDFFPPEDPAALAAALTRLFTDSSARERLSAAGQERAAQCGIGKMIAGYHKLYSAHITRK